MIIIDMRSEELVIKNLLFLYHACVASEQLLVDAAQSDPPDIIDGFHARLIDYYMSHLEEEKDEIDILREDLASRNIRPGFPDRFSMAMIGSQYYLIKHLHPVCLLGYLAMQEVDPTSVKTVEMLEELYGRNLFRFMRLHAIKDLEHSGAIKELIESASLALQTLIEFSAFNALGHYAEAIHSWK